MKQSIIRPYSITAVSNEILCCSEVIILVTESIYQANEHKSSKKKETKTPWPESASELSDRCMLAKLVPTFVDRESHVVSVTDPYDRILDFLDRRHYFFFHVAPLLYSRS
jgi:hypothetical protein